MTAIHLSTYLPLYLTGRGAFFYEVQITSIVIHYPANQPIT